MRSGSTRCGCLRSTPVISVRVATRATNSSYAAMKELLALREPPDGVFCFNDEFALNAMKAVLDADFANPGRRGARRQRNIRYADSLRVPLTTVDQNAVAIGESAARLALTMIEARTPPRAKTILLEARLVLGSRPFGEMPAAQKITGSEVR